MAKRERIFAGFGAALFLVTSSALTIAVILTMSSSSNNAANATAPTASTTKSNSIAAINFKVGSALPSQIYKPTSAPVSSLKYADIAKGTGPVVKSTDTVTANYVGFLLSNGKVFDDSASHGGAQIFPLNGVIKGWQLGLTGMRVGGTRELYIPSNLAYGSQSTNGIPANSNLGFYVQVQAVK